MIIHDIFVLFLLHILVSVGASGSGSSEGGRAGGGAGVVDLIFFYLPRSPKTNSLPFVIPSLNPDISSQLVALQR